MSEKKLFAKVKQVRNLPHSESVQVRQIRGVRQNIDADKILVEIRGRIPKVDRERKMMEIQTAHFIVYTEDVKRKKSKPTHSYVVPSSGRIKTTFSESNLPEVLQVFNGYGSGVRALIKGTGRLSNHTIRSLESITSIKALDPNDIPSRLEELAKLEDGWLDGEGRALDPARLRVLEGAFAANYPDHLPLPYLYPTAEGGVQAEWSLNGHEITLEIDLKTIQAEWHCSQLGSRPGEDQYWEIDLSKSRNWPKLVAEIQRCDVNE